VSPENTECATNLWEKERGKERKRKEERWENFCEQKFSQALSKNFNWVTRREQRVTKTLFGSMETNFGFDENDFIA